MIDDAVLGTEEEIMAELAEMSAEFAPRRFTLCVIDEADAAVVGWGFEFDDEVVVYVREGVTGDRPCFRRFDSTEQALRRLGRDQDTRIVWIDPERSGQPELGE